MIPRDASSFGHALRTSAPAPLGPVAIARIAAAAATVLVAALAIAR